MGTSWVEESAAIASFLAVVPQQSVADSIERLQASAGVALTVAPHVTFKAQPGLDPAGDWRTAVAATIGQFPSFEFSLGPVGWFGDDVLFLHAQSAALVRLHLAILKCLERIGITQRYEYEGGAFVPHLTLGAAFAGATREQLEQLAASAAGCRWARVPVATVVEFHRGSSTDPYRPTNRFSLQTA
jgi:2'-5' RNA ligase